MENNKNKKWELRKEVFYPAIVIIGGAALIGILNNKALTTMTQAFFEWSLQTFGWLYQIASIVALLVVFALLFSRYGNVKIGGKDAVPKYSFMTWFAMALTGGVASGIVTWGVNEPLIYYGNIWGELDGLAIQPFSAEALRFAMGRSFYNWTFIPYAMYTLCGLAVAYTYFNKKKKLGVATTLTPILGEKLTGEKGSSLIDVLSMLAIALGLTSGLTACITLLTSGINYKYNIPLQLPLFVGIGVLIIFLFTSSSYVGLDKGMKRVADMNAYFYYGILIFLFVVGPTLFILRNSTAGMAEWMQNFWKWGLDPIDIGGPALVQSWTLFDWAVWIAYAPVMGIFLAIIARGRTIKEFIIVNCILPSVFGIIWFGVWGNYALKMQMDGVINLVQVIQNNSAVTALWAFLDTMPFGLGTIIIPFNIIIILVSFVTAADATSTTVASMCVKDLAIGEEAPGKLKVLWGVLIGSIAVVMAIFGGGEQGVQGVKSLATAGGFFVLFIFILQIIAVIKMFFIDKIVE